MLAFFTLLTDTLVNKKVGSNIQTMFFSPNEPGSNQLSWMEYIETGQKNPV